MKKRATANAVWTLTGDLAIRRSFHTATVLANGKVLVAGGSNTNAILDSAELYDEATGTWSPTGSLRGARVSHTATLLPSGKVLVSGGRFGIVSIKTAELYDPVTGKWKATASMAKARNSHTATLLPSGLVLVAGGIDDSDFADRTDSAELYDPVTGKWHTTGHLTLDNGRSNHTATLLDDGTVLIVGGNTFGPLMADGAELYDPIKGVWTATGSPTTVRVDHTATRLANGKVLVVGGVKSNSPSDQLDSAEIYDPAKKIFTATGALNTARNRHSATLLRNGKVLVAGGFKDIVAGGITENSTLNLAELYDLRRARWSVTARLNEARGEQSAVGLKHGEVLVAAGSKRGDGPLMFLNGAELFRLKTRRTAKPVKRSRKRSSGRR